MAEFSFRMSIIHSTFCSLIFKPQSRLRFKLPEYPTLILQLSIAFLLEIFLSALFKLVLPFRLSDRILHHLDSRLSLRYLTTSFLTKLICLLFSILYYLKDYFLQHPQLLFKSQAPILSKLLSLFALFMDILKWDSVRSLQRIQIGLSKAVTLLSIRWPMRICFFSLRFFLLLKFTLSRSMLVYFQITRLLLKMGITKKLYWPSDEGWTSQYTIVFLK